MPSKRRERRRAEPLPRFEHLLASTDRTAFVALLESSVFRHKRLSKESKVRIARAIAASADAFLLQRHQDVMRLTLAELGTDASEPLFEAVWRTKSDETREICFGALGDMCRATSNRRAFAKVFKGLNGLFDSEDFYPKNALCRALGAAAASPAATPTKIAALWKKLEKLTGSGDLAFDAVEAIGWMASGTKASSGVKLSSALLLLGVLDSTMPEDISKDLRTDDGFALEIKDGVSAYTDLIPSALSGIERICLSKGLPKGFVTKVASKMLSKWKANMAFEVVWGPANSSQLTSVLGSIASSPDVTDDVKNLAANELSRHMFDPNAALALARVVSSAGDSKETLRISERAVSAVLNLRSQKEFSDPEFHGVIIESLVLLGCRSRLASSDAISDNLRKLVLDSVRTCIAMEGLNSRALAAMASSGNYPKEMIDAAGK